eukprot:7622255-Heterocapsa_arctica.AAC.1
MAEQLANDNLDPADLDVAIWTSITRRARALRPVVLTSHEAVAIRRAERRYNPISSSSSSSSRQWLVADSE